jgi:SAM-dependent methyltransferase
MRESGVTSATDQVGHYFSDRASDYQSRSIRFPWVWVRTRELNALRSLLGDVAGADILELGAGAGFYTRELIGRGARHVWAVDLSAAMLASLPAGPITSLLGNAATVRIDRSFPVIFSAGMIEFVPDAACVLANAADHAEAGARFIMLAPRQNVFGRLYRRYHQAHGLAIQLFNKSWFETNAPRLGWRVTAMVPVQPLSLAVRLHRL